MLFNFPSYLVNVCIRTNSVRLAVLSSHHEWGLPCSVDTVDLSIVAQQQLETLHMVCEGRCMQGGPAQIKSVLF